MASLQSKIIQVDCITIQLLIFTYIQWNAYTEFSKLCGTFSGGKLSPHEKLPSDLK